MIAKREINWGGRTLSIEAGNWAQQATGSAVVRYGDTMVLCTVVADYKSAPIEEDFFPLTVNYVEKAYAAGKIPGGFVKREGKPTEHETLVSRLIDRPIRPLFHKNFKNETQVICTVLSYDGENDADVISIIGTSAALTFSGLPFLGPIAAAHIGYEKGAYVLNPRVGHESNIDLTIAGSRGGVLMVESGSREVSEEEMLGAIKFGHESFQPVIDMILSLADEVAKDPWPVAEDNKEQLALTAEIAEQFMNDIKSAYDGVCKQDRNAGLRKVQEKIAEHYAEKIADGAITEQMLAASFHDVCSTFIREKILKHNTRIDGRSPTDIRPISGSVDVLPTTHGSAVFMRGETQALAVATLGTAQDEQLVDNLSGEHRQRFMLHYNFPPFSVGEISRLGSPGRREIGHGRLAWRAVRQVLPSKDAFPYCIRVVSEVLSCNGSSSMATVCGASMALMDAGVPITNPVAGIAMGLIMDENPVILSDIMGEEDHLGDMDFKVTGTENGITALQMDIKVNGVSFDIMERAMAQAKEGRLHILKEMAKVIDKPRKDINPNAPKITNIIIPKDKIREVIGTGGKVIREIIDASGAKVDIEESGNVTVFAPNTASMTKALNMIKGIALEPEPGEIYEAKIMRIMEFGAFVRFFGPKEGLVHVSEMSNKRVEHVSDIVSEGDTVRVKFLGYDGKGRAKLTMRI